MKEYNYVMLILSDTNQFHPVVLEAKVSRANSSRATILEQFIGELNKEAGTRYKKDGKWFTQKAVKPSYIGVKLSHLSEAELWSFLSLCRQSQSGFNKCFYGCLKTKGTA